MKNIEDAPFITTFEQHLDKHYGKRGTPEREQYEAESRAFRISEMLKEERRLAKLTQEQLAKKTGTHKSLIARLERGKIELSTGMLNVLYETGFGKSFSL
jgi:ribosome-binding protein aMBF1 (putative translation factor)